MSRTSSGGSKDAPSALQGARWILGSIFTSVSCVMCNKRIFSLFPVPFALTATHFALTTMAQQLRGQTGNTGDLTMRHGQGGRPPPSNSQSKTSKSSSARSSSVEIKRGALPLYEAAKIGFLGNAAIGIMNLSLGKNSVAFYQLTKVSLVPGMVAFNFFVYRKTTPVRVCASLLLITIGLTLATVTDTNISAFKYRWSTRSASTLFLASKHNSPSHPFSFCPPWHFSFAPMNRDYCCTT
ncbi:unnamed protein product [Amoebophrya sp. A120]|nr:unnamed protein product [Amoebophrya sp. A120]|eukprot:GSA120T00015170001.1